MRLSKLRCDHPAGCEFISSPLLCFLSKNIAVFLKHGKFLLDDFLHAVFFFFLSFFSMSYFSSLPGLCWNAGGKQSPLFTSHTGPLTHFHHMFHRKTLEITKLWVKPERLQCVTVACTVHRGHVLLSESFDSVQMKYQLRVVHSFVRLLLKFDWSSV